MKDGRYEANDFSALLGMESECDDQLYAAERANALLPELEKQLREKWLREGTVVYATQLFSQRKAGKLPFSWNRRGPGSLHTHTAFLVDIKPIKENT